jgi:small subunit ribosomal protein S20
LANTKQAKKRVRQSRTHRELNMSQRSAMRTSIKKTVAAIATGNKTNATSAFKEAVPAIDSMVTKGLIHKNKAARHKSRLSAHIKKLAAK